MDDRALIIERVRRLAVLSRRVAAAMNREVSGYHGLSMQDKWRFADSVRIGMDFEDLPEWVRQIVLESEAAAGATAEEPLDDTQPRAPRGQ